MSEQPLYYLGAVDALARFADRSLSPVEPMAIVSARRIDDARVRRRAAVATR